MQLKTISILTDGIYPFVLGGMQKHSFYLAKYFASKNIEVHLYHFLPHNKSISDVAFTMQESKYIKHVIVDMPLADKYIGHYIRQCFNYSENILKQIILQPKTDIIYAQGFTAWALLKDKNARKNLPNIIVNFHGIEPFQETADTKSYLQKLMLKPYLKFNLLNADYVISLGGNLTKVLIKNGIEKDKIIETPIGIENNWLTSSITPKTNKTKFVFIGRNERRKALQEISIAIKEVEKNDAEFHFIGPITEIDLGINKLDFPNIFLHGAIYNQDRIKEILKTCNVLLCPSYSEGMPTVILEAMSCGLAVIATNVGATNQLVSNKTGWLIKSPEPKIIAQAINEAINISETNLMIKQQNAQQLIQSNYLWDDVINKTIDDLEKVINVNS